MTDYSQTISDSVGISDNQKREIEKVFADSLSLADVLDRANSFQRNLSEEVSLSDPIISPIFQFLTENLSIEDSPQKTAEFQRSVSENEDISDTAKDRWLRINVVYTIFY